jgi:hypothetical protein
MGGTIRDIMTKVTTGIIILQSPPSGVTEMITRVTVSPANGRTVTTNVTTGLGYIWTSRGTLRIPVVIAHPSWTWAMG